MKLSVIQANKLNEDIHNTVLNKHFWLSKPLWLVISALGKETFINYERAGAMLAKNGSHYKPGDEETFMNDRQKAYFRDKLNAWKEDILRESQSTIEYLKQENNQQADIADRASSETDRSLELRARDRQRKLISKIDAALLRIKEDTYGYCDVTGEPISLRRLEARPIATLSIEAQEAHERREKVHRDD